jgi:hypothetical protein
MVMPPNASAFIGRRRPHGYRCHAPFAPGRSTIPFRSRWARFRPAWQVHRGGSTGAHECGIDVRGVLAAISAPTLLIHRRNDARVDPDASRFLAKNIPNSRLVEIPGRDHPIWTGDVDRVADLIEEFLTGERAVVEADRVLAALLATRHDTARIGDRMRAERSQALPGTWRLLVGGMAAGRRHTGRTDDVTSTARRAPCAARRRCATRRKKSASPADKAMRRGELRGPPVGLTARVTMQIASHEVVGTSCLHGWSLISRPARAFIS